MIDVYVDYDEWYPVYSMDTETSWGKKCRVPQEFYNRWENTCEAFQEMQRLLRQMHDEAVRKEKLEASKTGIQPAGFD